MLTVVTALDSFKPVNPTRRLRVVTIVGLAVAWLVMSLLLSNATTALNTTLLIMLYLLVPWTAVNLTDYFFVRRGHYAIADLFTPKGIYGAWSWRGLTAFLVGIAAEIPFVVLPFFVGPVAKAMGESTSPSRSACWFPAWSTCSSRGRSTYHTSWSSSSPIPRLADPSTS